jgi:hypothetical protein
MRRMTLQTMHKLMLKEQLIKETIEAPMPKILVEPKQNQKSKNTKIFINKENPKAYIAPKAPGLYLIGSTHFNPITDEKFYLVKVGSTSTTLSTRMSSYRTHNPLAFHIDFLENCSIVNEGKYHEFMRTNYIIMENNKEWFIVDKQTYFEICEQGFKYFSDKI